MYSLQPAIRTALALALLPIANVIAQPSAPLVTLRVNTQLVQVSVVVKDAHGNPVAGLKAGDFELYDKGKKQEIRVFKVEDYRQSGAAQPAASPVPPPPSNAFSNRTPSDPGAPNAPTILVIDAGNTWDTNRMTWQDLVYASQQVVRFLRQIHPEDRLGIYLMNANRFWILREYTQNCADLIDRLASWKPSAARALDVWSEFAVHFARVDAETAKAIHRAQFWGTTAAPDVPAGPLEEHTPVADNQGSYLPPDQSRAHTVIEAVANHLGAVPGRKNVVLISGTFLLPPDRKIWLKILRNIIQAGVSIYAIDPGGLAPYALDASFVIPSRINMYANMADLYIDRSYQWKRQLSLLLQSSLTELAGATGGKVFVNTNHIQSAIRASFDDSRVTYTLGFYPRASTNDGSFHPLKVSTPGREHLSVKYRDGYFEPQPPQRDPQRREAELRQAIWSPVDATTVELSGVIAPTAGADGSDLKLNIGLAAVSLLPDSDHWNGQIEISLIQRDPSGNTYQPSSQTLGLKLGKDTYDQATKNGLPYVRSFKIDPKAASLRVIVRDLGSGNMGTLTIPLL